MDIKVSEKSLRQFLKTKASTAEIINALTLCGPTVDRYHKDGADTIFEIESITNRIDTASVFGVARDAHAILQQMSIDSSLISSPYNSSTINDKHQATKINIQIASTDLVIRFSAIIFRNCTVNDSPSETKTLLINSDQRPLNNLIDITNELTLLYGLPTHVFDLDKLAIQSLTIRHAKTGEKITTLDNQIHELETSDIIIEDGSDRIVDLCGIMGGQIAEVDDHTKNILFIAPVYNPKNIRQTSLRLQKRTLAAQIYEKSPDPELSLPIISLASKLIKERSGGEVSSQIFDFYPVPIKPLPVTLNLDWLKTFSGINIPDTSINQILTNLGFTDITVIDRNLSCLPPTFRFKDITISEDLAEEILRVYGYYRILGTLPAITTAPETPDALFDLEKKVRDFLSTKGYFEICNNSLISLEAINKYAGNSDNYLKLTNALSEDYEYLRNNLVISTLVNHKDNQGKTDLAKNFFEIANVYQSVPEQTLPNEISTLCISTDQPISSLKNTLEGFFDKLNQKNCSFNQDTPVSAIILNNDQPIGRISQISPQIQKNFGLENIISIIEINLPKFLQSLTIQKNYTPISEYPDLKFDITVSSKESIGEIIKKIKSHHSSIAEVKYLNSFQSKHSFQISLRSYTENLTKDLGNTIQQSLSSLF